MPNPGQGYDKENREHDFLTLFHQHRDHVYRFAYYLTGNSCEADDLFQETWLRVVRHIRKIEDVRNVRAWIMSITSNLYRDILRKKKARQIFSRSDPVKDDMAVLSSPPLMGAILDEAERRDFSFAAERAIERLPLRMRRVFVLKEIEGFSLKEIGSILNIPTGTVKSLQYRAVRKLQNMLAVFQNMSSGEME